MLIDIQSGKQCIVTSIVIRFQCNRENMYCTDATNPAMGIAESDDKRPANPAMTDDCRVDRQVQQ